MVHLLKCWPEFFALVFSGVKKFEVRKNDRNYQEGDVLVLREWDPETTSYSGKACVKKVEHVMAGGDFGVKVGYVVLGIGDAS